MINNRDSFVSGEEISERLNVTRAAVWKHVEELRALGFVIESRPRSGYRLVKIPDRLMPELVLPGLKTKFIGRTYRYFESVDSTNNVARSLAVQGFPHGTVVAAEEQAGGRGRRGRAWASPFGEGIYVSIVLKPEISTSDAPGLTLLAAVGVAGTINDVFGLPAVIKWPNDVLINGKKVCGILTELGAETDLIHYAVVGIGLNVNTVKFAPDIENVATSIAKEAGRKIDRIRLFQSLLRELERVYLSFARDGMAPVISMWRRYSATLGRRVKIVTLKETFEGVAEDIETDGRLRVKKDSGDVVLVHSADVSLR